MRFSNEEQAVTYIFESLANSNWRNRGLDEHSRNTKPSQQLLDATESLKTPRYYAVVTGSKGKGSITTISARLMRELGYTVGTITSPHLTSYRERFRVNGRMISEADFLRLVDWLAPYIDKIVSSLPDNTYLSPQGIFLAMALKYFDEKQVNVAIIEVGRGGRFDDNALVPNELSLFGPITLEHQRYLGQTIDRIAWHKAGIIKPESTAITLPQQPEALREIRTEAQKQNATLHQITPEQLGKHIQDTPNGMLVDFTQLGRVELPLFGHYSIDNASIALAAVDHMHTTISNEAAYSPEYNQTIKTGLENIFWAGRCQKIAENPTIFVDGAITPMAVSAFIDSVQTRITHPVITVAAVPTDRDLRTVYQQLLSISDVIIVTQTARNITIKFPDFETVQSIISDLRPMHDSTKLFWTNTIEEAIPLAKSHASNNGTVLMSIAQPAIGDVMQYYNLKYEQI